VIGYVLSLARWEWFKQRRRWLPWVLLAILALIPQAAIWGSFGSYHFQSNDSDRQMVFGVSGAGQRPIEAHGDGRVSGGRIGQIVPGGSVSVNCDDILSGNVPELPPGFPPEVLDDFERECRRDAVQNDQIRADEYDAFAFPASLGFALQFAVGFGVILLIVLTTSVVGTEYSWGTLRNVLARGTGRWQFMAGKATLLVFLALGGLLTVMALTAVSSLIAVSLTDTPVGYVSSTTWLGLLESLGRAWYGLIPYIALAGFATVLVGSSALGLSLSIGYYIGEQILSGLMSALFDWFDTIGDYLLGPNIAAWVSGGGGNTDGLLMGMVLDSPPGQLHASLVMAAYIVGLSALALWRFSRRDVGGASGG